MVLGVGEVGAEPWRRVVISGASGLIGSHLRRDWSARGVQCWRLVRRPPRSDEEIEWDPAQGRVDEQRLEGMDAVVHLAGEPVAGYWTRSKKQRIRASRLDGTRALAQAIAGLKQPPRVWISASAIGYYGDRGATPLTEESPVGEGFLANVCAQWEAACEPVWSRTRVVNPRIGIVVAAEGGALRQMLPPFLLGMGGPLSSGEQYMSWISLHDLSRVIEHCIRDEAIRGPVNAVAPAPVTNAEWTATLASQLRRPAWMRVPRLALRARFGEFADELLASQRAEPAVLVNTGFQFDDPQLRNALERVLERTTERAA